MTERFNDLQEVEEANRRAGQHFFSSQTMRFFKSRVHYRLYGGRFFVTSERDDWNDPRRYTVRRARPNGTIATVGTFQQYAHRTSAHREAERLGREAT